MVELARRDFGSRYRNGVLGVASVFLVPILFLGTYTFVFSTLVPIKPWPTASRSDYAFFLFSGLLAWNLLAETIARAPALFQTQAHFLRRAHFPPAALPLSVALAAYYQSLVWLSVFVVARALLGSWPGVWILATPLLLGLAGVVAAGLALGVSALGALMRDLSQLVAPALSLGAFVSPVFYPAEQISAVAPWLVQLNPLAPVLFALREVLIHGRGVSPLVLLAICVWAALCLAGGWVAYMRVRPLLADLV